MSIATLKRKTAAKYNNSSVGQKQFSLNGGYRNQGFVGQTMLSRSLPRTLFNGATPRGSGGCCGTFPVKTTVQSSTNYFENNKIIKSSVMNTRGLVATKYAWALRPKPFSALKPDSNQNYSTQQDYIKNIRNHVIHCNPTDKCDGKIKPAVCPKTCSNMKYSSFTVPDIKNSAAQSITKPESQYTSMSQGDYLYTVYRRADLDVYNDISNKTNTNGTVCPGCVTTY
jgi:hypothetical protein